MSSAAAIEATDAARRAPGTCPPVALLTAGIDKPYTFGLAMALADAGAHLDLLGSPQVDCPEYHESPNIRFLNLRRDQAPRAGALAKLRRILDYYVRLLGYAARAKPRIFHVLWNNRFDGFDRTLLMLYYKALGKKIVLTAHNVNERERDCRDSAWNRLTLGCQYRLADRIFVHTEGMKRKLCRGFAVSENAVRVIPFGINNAVPETDLTRERARAQLGLAAQERAILFFGNIRPYKGLDLLVEAFSKLAGQDARYRLIVAGARKQGSDAYLDQILERIREAGLAGRAILRLEHVPDEETEIYFKAADVLALPYRDISWSGVLILGYAFGLPAVATDVGTLGEEIVRGETGFVCPPHDPEAFAAALAAYFGDTLFAELGARRERIRTWARTRYDWNAIARMMAQEYAALAGR